MVIQLNLTGIKSITEDSRRISRIEVKVDCLLNLANSKNENESVNASKPDPKNVICPLVQSSLTFRVDIDDEYKLSFEDFSLERKILQQ